MSLLSAPKDSQGRRIKRIRHMSDQVSWLLELAVKPGELDNLRALMAEMVESTQGEPGTLAYEWSIDEGGGVVHVYERYADSAAVMAHLGTFGKRFADRFLGAVGPTRFTVFGTPSAELRAALDGFGATYLQPFGGFAR